jgi:hypothetical protein
MRRGRWQRPTHRAWAWTIDPQAVRRYQLPVEIRVAGRTLYTSPDFGP